MAGASQDQHRPRNPSEHAGLVAIWRAWVSVFTLDHLLVLTLQLRGKSNRCLPNLAYIHLAAGDAGGSWST